ncbi:hypothetical protein [Amycolatopsis albispora]|uniref:MarR family transcriptional regulator n=1 Tax=Amycolatopsis albispora TaxID=1804986 RepID=A0A344L1T2_9PSEU|nr:hypothetical protein [Amycolatopsis albispora]AXB42006.1 hypothetical protein A4R43_05245 [Amycolatopsis albispora]
MSEQSDELSHRALAMLRAVAERRAMMSGSCEPDLFIDGFACCDQVTAHALARAGYLRPAEAPARPGARVRAELTPAGWAAVGVVAAA